MKIKKYTAKDMRRALALIKEDMGADAVILSNRRLENHGNGGGVEILAASEYDATLLAHMSNKNSASDDSRASAASPAGENRAASINRKTTSRNKPRTSAQKPTRIYSASDNTLSENTDKVVREYSIDQINTLDSSRTADVAEEARPAQVKNNEVHHDRARTRAPRTTKFSNIDFNNIEEVSDNHEAGNSVTNKASVQNDALGDMFSELKSLRAMIENRFSIDDWDKQSSMHPLRISLFRKLTDLGLSQDVCKFLVKDINEKLDFATASKLALKRLVRNIPIDHEDVLSHGGIIAMVGPTGVGKTTTIAKIAARFVMRHGNDQVALISTDNYRIGAREQLLNYGRIIGVPFHTANNAEQLSAILQRVYDKKLVLIDTAGMSQQDIRLTQQFAALNSSAALIRTYLVMSANAQLPALDDVVKSFRKANLAGCIFTKTDESASLGGALSIIMRHNLPVAYISNGQRVPEDIHPARANSMVTQALQMMKSHKHENDDEFMAVTFSGGVSHAHL